MVCLNLETVLLAGGGLVKLPVTITHPPRGQYDNYWGRNGHWVHSGLLGAQGMTRCETAQHSHSRRLSSERPVPCMDLLGEGYRRLLVLAVRMDCQLAAVGNRNQDGSVHWPGLVEQVEQDIQRGCKLERENSRRLGEEERSLWMGSNCLAFEGS